MTEQGKEVLSPVLFDTVLEIRGEIREEGARRLGRKRENCFLLQMTRSSEENPKELTQNLLELSRDPSKVTGLRDNT